MDKLPKIKERTSSNIKTHLSKNQPSFNWLEFLKKQNQNANLITKKIVKKPEPKKKLKITKVLAMDCEMVSNKKDENMLARVSIVNYNLECIYDKFVKPTEVVGDYRTKVSGIRPENIANGEDFQVVQKEVRDLLRKKILVGHALHNDFRVLGFTHNWKYIRDTAKYKPFREANGGKSPSLKKLTETLLKEKIQDGEHNSIEDARAAMKLYLMHKFEWESSILSLSQPKNVGKHKRFKRNNVEDLILPEF